MNYLIAGGAGFIGINLIKKLLENENNYITCVDNLSTSVEKNIEQFYNHKNFIAFLKKDICDWDIKHDAQWDRIINLACPASPVHYQRDGLGTILTNVVGTNKMLSQAYFSKARFLQASTSEIYGDPTVHPQHEDYFGNVNCYGPRSCFSSDTEVLTDKGWMKFENLTGDEYIATLLDGKYLEYNKPIEVIKQKYTGSMCRYVNWNIDLDVTPNHKMYAKHVEESNFRFIEADGLTRYGKHRAWYKYNLKKDVIYDSTDIENFILPSPINWTNNMKKNVVREINMDDWLEFLGYYLSEGCSFKNNGSYVVTVSQDKSVNPEKCAKIESCLNRLPFYWFKYTDHQYGISHKQLYYYMKQFGKSHEKFIPREFMLLSKRQLKILFDALMLGDGSGRTYYSTSYQLMSDVQEILFKLGYFANIGISTPSKDNRRTLYCMNYMGGNIDTRVGRKYPKVKYINYDGYVHCVSIKNHVIYVRRNGKAVWCGNCYDEGKRCAEALVWEYHKKHTDTRMIRIFNTYGPYMAADDGRVVSNFIVAALKGENLIINGDGKQTRSFCYVDDLVDGLVAVLEGKFPHPLNLGNPGEFNVNTLASMILVLTNSNSKVIYRPALQDDPKQRRPDITDVKYLVGWEPKISLTDGLKKTIEYFEKELSRGN